MSNKEKLCIDNLLSWQDVMQLSGPIVSMITKSHLIQCAEHNYQKELFDQDFNKYVIEPLSNQFPYISSDFNDFDIRLRYDQEENGDITLKYSLPFFLTSVLRKYDVRNKLTPTEYREYKDVIPLIDYNELLRKILRLSEQEMIDEFLNIFDSFKKSYTELINDYNNPTSIFNTNDFSKNRFMKSHSTVKIYNQSTRDKLIEGRRNIVLLKKNINDIVSFFNDKTISTNLFQNLNKDAYVLFVASLTINKSNFFDYFGSKIDYKELTNHISEQKLSEIINFINNYCLVIEYIAEENNEIYEYVFRYIDGDNKKMITASEVIELFRLLINKLCKESNFNEKPGFYKTYEELLSSKANETWKRIQNTKLVESIKVSFEMITSGKSNYSIAPIRSRVNVKSNSEKRQAQLKKDYDLLDQKFDYYGSKKPVIELRGINNFVGYFAQFYKNGVVVLDKYYKYSKDRKGNDKVIPASGEAIYFMNNREFAELCRYTKPELIEEKKCNNPDVGRTTHKGKWTERVDEVINGPGYGELDLEFLNMLIKALGGETGYQKTK